MWSWSHVINNNNYTLPVAVFVMILTQICFFISLYCICCLRRINHLCFITNLLRQMRKVGTVISIMPSCHPGLSNEHRATLSNEHRVNLGNCHRTTLNDPWITTGCSRSPNLSANVVYAIKHIVPVFMCLSVCSANIRLQFRTRARTLQKSKFNRGLGKLLRNLCGRLT